MQTGSVRTFLDGVLSSDEYVERLAKRQHGSQAGIEGPFLNCWVDGWEHFARPVGSLSSDGVAIVGRQGHLFIYGGANNNLAAYKGEITLAEDWMESWQDLLKERYDYAHKTGRRLACVVVPEKLAVYGDFFPGDLEPRSLRPALMLRKRAQLPLVYPQEELRGARHAGDTFLRTDSHLTLRGNLLLASATIKALGVDTSLLTSVQACPSTYLAAGDLGQHFDPPVVEVMKSIGRASQATLVSDNWAEVAEVGGHIGVRRVFRYDDAPEKRTVVVFGDSYSFGDEAYQGLSWFLAQIFSEMHFLWVPFGWDPGYLDGVGADLVVCQTAERFLGRVPNRRVDVLSLAQETISRRRPHMEETIFRA